MNKIQRLLQICMTNIPISGWKSFARRASSSSVMSTVFNQTDSPLPRIACCALSSAEPATYRNRCTFPATSASNQVMHERLHEHLLPSRVTQFPAPQHVAKRQGFRSKGLLLIQKRCRPLWVSRFSRFSRFSWFSPCHLPEQVHVSRHFSQ